MRERVQSFPGSIPFNCVDKCLLALDGINEPMLFHLVLDLEGDIDLVRLNGAISSAQQAHPVMRTILQSRHSRLFRQIQENIGRGVLSIADQAQLQDTNCEHYLSSWMSQPLDLKKEFPVRVLLLRRNETESLLVFTFHHSATDGLRALLFVRKTIEIYNGELRQDGEARGSPAGDLGDIRMNRRGDELLQFAHSQRSEVQHYYGKVLFSLFQRFVISTLPPPTRVFHDRCGRSRELRFCFAVLSPGELEQIQSKAKSVGVTLNDILLAACYRVVDRWNSMHGKVSRRIRIMTPVNMGLKGFRYVVSNQASWFSLSTTPTDRTDPAKLLREVRADTTDAAMHRTAFSLIYYFYLCSRFPLFVMRWMCRFLIITRTYVDTILITNVGFIWPKPGSEEAAVSTMGNVRIRNVAGFAPVVTPMGLSITAGTYNRNLNLSLTYRPALFSEEKAKIFLDLYVEEIRNYQVGVQIV